MRKNNTIKRMTALFLMLIMVVTILPQPVQAAGVSVTPGDIQLIAGGTVQLKVRGLYRKVTWKSANTGIAAVTSKGKVTAKKSGSTRINATITLKNGRKATDYCKVVVLSSGKLVTLKSADDATAAKVHKYLTGNTPFSIAYYGSRNQAESTLNKLKEKVGIINGYGVLFQNEKAEQANGSQKKGYVYRVTKDNCRLYNYSLKYFKRLVTETINGIFNDADEDEDGYVLKPNGRLAFARKFNTWQKYKAELERLSPWIEYEDGSISLKENSEDLPDYYPNGCGDDDIRRCWLAANTKFCDLSQAMKVWIISYSGFFAGRDVDREYGLFVMTYGDPAGASRNQSDTERMKYMSENKAVGVCEDYARYEVTVFSQLGIKSKYDHDGGHAWSVVYPTNADGKKLKYIFNWHLCYDDDAECYGMSDSENDIY